MSNESVGREVLLIRSDIFGVVTYSVSYTFGGEGRDFSTNGWENIVDSLEVADRMAYSEARKFGLSKANELGCNLADFVEMANQPDERVAL